MKNLQHYLDQYLLRCLDDGQSLVQRLMKEAISNYFLSQSDDENNDRALAQVRFIYNVIGTEALDAILWAQESDIPPEAPDDPYSLLRSIDEGDALEIALDYIANQDSSDAFRDHVLNSVGTGALPEDIEKDLDEALDLLEITADGRKPEPLLIAPPKKNVPQFFKSIYTLEVLSDRPTTGMAQDDIVDECLYGDFSGEWKQLTHTRITPHETALALIEQGSDPEFLLRKNAWKYQLKRGDTAAYQPDDYDRPIRQGKIFYIEHCLEHCLVQWIPHEPILTVDYDELYLIEELPVPSDTSNGGNSTPEAKLDIFSEIQKLLTLYGIEEVSRVLRSQTIDRIEG